MKPSYCLCVILFLLASVLVVSSAVSPTETSGKTTAWRRRPAAPQMQPDEAFLARLCEEQRQRGRLHPWCKRRLPARRRHLPMPPPSRDDVEIDPRYGVSKELVPGGPNKLHN
ncbi:hypothetical protein ACP70R_038378 [Stipagrostis hirtigluma subsp. patula]